MTKDRRKKSCKVTKLPLLLEPKKKKGAINRKKTPRTEGKKISAKRGGRSQKKRLMPAGEGNNWRRSVTGVRVGSLPGYDRRATFRRKLTAGLDKHGTFP